MLVKSLCETDNVPLLEECFEILNKYQMKLNPAKCSLGVSYGKFISYLVTQRGIDVNPDQLHALRSMPFQRNRREVQRLTGRIAALNRFISRATNKCLPFYSLLKANKKAEWNEKCEELFAQLKEYMATPPILAKPVNAEPLYLYVTVSHQAVSGVLVQEDRGDQKPVFYISKSLVDAKTRYPAMEKLALEVVTATRKLRPYFQSHTIIIMTTQPLIRKVDQMGNRTTTG